MAINPIQFQKGLSLAQFMKDYGTEEQSGSDDACPLAPGF